MSPISCSFKAITISVIASCILSAVAQAETSSVDEKRAGAILNAFNSLPEELISPLTRDQVHIRDGQGRVDVNLKAKFSYFIQTADPTIVSSSMLLIPMATSRYTPTYYQTDEWWEAHKQEIEKAKREGTPPPKQDEVEVEKWLKEMKLSTNPFVLEISGEAGLIARTRLQTFLSHHILSNYVQDGHVVLYRGGEKPGEFESWAARVRPKGVRYWTPTANYAWRYARKNKNFMADLVDGKAPLFVFKVPVEDFRRMVDREWPLLTLGTELTKNAHNAFDSQGVFQDHLYGMEYPGEGKLGVEIELRANRQGSLEMTRYFVGSVSIQELANDRVRVLSLARERTRKQYPSRSAQIDAQIQQRIDRTLAEARVLIALKEKLPREIVHELLQKVSGPRAEIAYIDFLDFSSFVRERASRLPSDPSANLTSMADFDSRYGLNN